MAFLSSLKNYFAPAVCAFCEGGSGVVYSTRLGTVKLCAACNGTGVAAGEMSDLQTVVDNRLSRRRGRRSVA